MRNFLSVIRLFPRLKSIRFAADGSSVKIRAASNRPLPYVGLVFLCAVFIFNTTACSSGYVPKETRTEFALGTIVAITVYAEGETAESAFNAAFDRIDEIERMCSYTLADSELNRLNTSAYGEPFTVSEELFSLIEHGLHYSEQTGGAFDITLGKLIDLWGGDWVPDEAEISALLPHIGYENVIIDRDNNTVEFKNEHIKIHLGAIAKGYAIDQLNYILESAEFGGISAIIDLGGDVGLVGESPRSDGMWRIGITDPFDKNKSAHTIVTDKAAVVTSGNYERFFEVDGVMYHHILDRETGYPANSGFVSVTVTGGSGISSDALSTALFVMGEDKIEDFVKNMNNRSVVTINEAGEIYEYNCGDGDSYDFFDFTDGVALD